MTSSTLASVFTGMIETFWGYLTGLLTPAVGFIIAFGLLVWVISLVVRRRHGVTK